MVIEWEGKIVNLEKDKCKDLKFFEYSKLPQNILPYIRKALIDIKKGRFYSEIGWD